MDISKPHTLSRILVISPWKNRWSLGRGAGVSDDDHFISQLSAQGIELHFLRPASAERDTNGVTSHTYPNFFEATNWLPSPIRRLLWPFLFFVVVSFRGLQVARKVRPDFILAHSHYGSISAYLCRELLRIPSGLKLFGVMDLVHTEWPKRKYYYKNIEQIFALKIPQDLWIILDDGTRGLDAATRHGVPPDRIQFLPNGINTEWANDMPGAKPARNELGIPQDVPVVLFLARFVASKRPELVVQSIAAVRERVDVPPLFLFVGDGPEKGRCETMARRIGVESLTRFLGAIPHDQVPRIMAASDVFVSTSTLTNAAIPTCEAMVCGVPVVAFDVGNTTTVIRDGKTGSVVADGDTEALAEALADLLSDDAKRRAIAESARQYAMENFTGWSDRIQMEIDAIDATVRERHP